MTILNDTRLVDFQAKVKELGKAEGEGKNAKPEYAKQVVAVSNADLIKTEDAMATWDIYDKAAAKAKGVERERLSNDDTRKVRASETRQLIGFGKLKTMQAEPGKPDKLTPMAQFDKFVDVINGDRCKDIDGSTYSLLVKLCRKQNERPLLAFNEDEMVATLQGEAKAAKDELARLKAIWKAMNRTHNGTKEDPTDSFPSEELATAMTIIEGRIGVLEVSAALANVDKAKAKVAAMGKATAPAPGLPAMAE